MNVLADIVGFILVFTVLVVLHEWGHYLAARWVKVPVLAFSVGFGREIWGYTDRRGTRWRLGLWPIGGYVKLYGERAPQEDPSAAPSSGAFVPEEGQKTLGEAKAWERLVVSLGGVFFNLLGALGIFWALFWGLGAPSLRPVIKEVVDRSPAQRAGLRAGDIPLRLQGRALENLEDFVTSLAARGARTVRLDFLRDGVEQGTVVAVEEVVGPDGQKRGQIGIYLDATVFYRPLGFWRAGHASVTEVSSSFVMIFRYLGRIIFGREDYRDLGSVITIAQVSGAALSQGFIAFMGWIALFSVNLAAVNLLPFPLLDGGVALFALYEMIFRRPPAAAVLRGLGVLGLALIVFLMLLALSNDFRRLFDSFF